MRLPVAAAVVADDDDDDVLQTLQMKKNVPASDADDDDVPVLQRSYCYDANYCCYVAANVAAGFADVAAVAAMLMAASRHYIDS